MTDEKSRAEELKESIEQLRDEVNLKAHLAKAEARDELEKLDKKWKSFLDHYKPIADEAGKAAENASTALGLAADELKAGYERIRVTIQQHPICPRSCSPAY